MLTIHPKAAGAGIGGALAVIILWAMSYGVEVPPEVAGAFTAVIAAVCSWLAPWIPAPKVGTGGAINITSDPPPKP